MPVTPAVSVNRLVFGSRCVATYVVFLGDQSAKPLFVHIAYDGKVSSSERHDAKMLVNAECTVNGTGTSTNFNDLWTLVNGSLDIYVFPMIAEAEKQAAAKGYVIHWV